MSAARHIPDFWSNRKSEPRILINGRWVRPGSLKQLIADIRGDTQPQQVLPPSADELMPMSLLDIIKP